MDSTAGETYQGEYGDLITNPEGLEVYEADFYPENESGIYQILYIDNSEDPNKLAFGDQDVDPNRDGTSAEKRILSIGPEPEYFYYQ